MHAVYSIAFYPRSILFYYVLVYVHQVLFSIDNYILKGFPWVVAHDYKSSILQYHKERSSQFLMTVFLLCFSISYPLSSFLSAWRAFHKCRKFGFQDHLELQILHLNPLWIPSFWYPLFSQLSLQSNPWIWSRFISHFCSTASSHYHTFWYQWLLSFPISILFFQLI